MAALTWRDRVKEASDLWEAITRNGYIVVKITS